MPGGRAPSHSEALPPKECSGEMGNWGEVYLGVAPEKQGSSICLGTLESAMTHDLTEFCRPEFPSQKPSLPTPIQFNRVGRGHISCFRLEIHSAALHLGFITENSNCRMGNSSYSTSTSWTSI